MTTQLISDQHLMTIFYSPDSPQAYARRTYQLAYGSKDSDNWEIKTFHAYNLKEAKLLAREFVTRFTRADWSQVTFLGMNKW